MRARTTDRHEDGERLPADTPGFTATALQGGLAAADKKCATDSPPALLPSPVYRLHHVLPLLREVGSHGRRLGRAEPRDRLPLGHALRRRLPSFDKRHLERGEGWCGQALSLRPWATAGPQMPRGGGGPGPLEAAQHQGPPCLARLLPLCPPACPPSARPPPPPLLLDEPARIGPSWPAAQRARSHSPGRGPRGSVGRRSRVWCTAPASPQTP